MFSPHSSVHVSLWMRMSLDVFRNYVHVEIYFGRFITYACREECCEVIKDFFELEDDGTYREVQEDVIGQFCLHALG